MRLSLRGRAASALLVVLPACGSTPAGPTAPCSFTLSASSAAFPSDGGEGSVAVATAGTCAWSTSTVAGWITLASPASAVGPGTVRFSVAPNTTTAFREATLRVADAPFTIRQDGAAACSFAIDPERRDMPHDGGAASVSVVTASGCAWTAVSAVPWITITTGPAGTGPGVVDYRVSENNSVSSRSGSLSVATRTHTVEQQGEAPPACEYRVSPVDLAPCMAAGTLTATVTTTPSCRWTAEADSSWLTITGGRSGLGTGTITAMYSDNYRAPRHGVIMVRWDTPSLGQNVHVAQAGCFYGVSRTSIDVAAAGGAASLDVLQESEPVTCGGPLQDQCVWTARSDVGWIAIATPMPQVGDHLLALTVSANAGPGSRDGHVTIGDQVVTVSQAAP